MSIFGSKFDSLNFGAGSQDPVSSGNIGGDDFLLSATTGHQHAQQKGVNDTYVVRGKDGYILLTTRSLEEAHTAVLRNPGAQIH